MRHLLLALALSLSGPAFADYFSGNDLKQVLIDSDRDIDEAMFRGYVAGVQDSYNGILFCVPAKVNLAQASAVVSKYIDGNPESWHEVGKVLVVDALVAAYPCAE